MTTIHRIRKIFVRQLNENDCGIACLCMVLNYAGQAQDVQSFRESFTIPDAGASLLQLKTFAGELGLASKCVTMDIDHLRQSVNPTILHMVNQNGNNHFQLCFGSLKHNNSIVYIMADPAHYVHLLSEADLITQWKSHSALVFDKISKGYYSWKLHYWRPLFYQTNFPKWLLLSFALISIITAFFGVAITWVLQSGINDPLMNKKGSIIVATVILLLIISLFKSVLGYVKQQIMIKISLQINEQLISKFLTKVCTFNRTNRMQFSQSTIKAALGDIQKIQNAIALLMGTLVADGTLILFAVLGICYHLPFAALINVFFLTASFLISITNVPGLIYQNSSLNGLAGNFENSLLDLIHGRNRTTSLSETNAVHLESHKSYATFARKIADKLGRINLLTECIGTMNVITVFSLGLYGLRNESISYTSFMLIVVLTYFATTLMTKISAALYAITDGNDAALQLSGGVIK